MRLTNAVVVQIILPMLMEDRAPARLPKEPTQFPPRTPSKINVMAQRARRREILFRDDDAKFPENMVLICKQYSNVEPYVIGVMFTDAPGVLLDPAPPYQFTCIHSDEEKQRRKLPEVRALDARRKRAWRERQRKAA